MPRSFKWLHTGNKNLDEGTGSPGAGCESMDSANHWLRSIKTQWPTQSAKRERTKPLWCIILSMIKSNELPFPQKNQGRHIQVISIGIKLMNLTSTLLDFVLIFMWSWPVFIIHVAMFPYLISLGNEIKTYRFSSLRKKKEKRNSKGNHKRNEQNNDLRKRKQLDLLHWKLQSWICAVQINVY